MSNIIRRNSFDPFFDLFDFPFEGERKNDVMKTDIEENDNAYKLSVEVPSVKKEDVKVSLKEGYLNIFIEKKNESTDKDNHGKVLHRERYYGSFKRSFYVGDEIKESDISASMNDGVLTVTVQKPKPIEEQPVNYIEIK